MQIMLPKTSAYVKCYDVMITFQTKWMHFMFEDDDLLDHDDLWWLIMI